MIKLSAAILLASLTDGISAKSCPGFVTDNRFQQYSRKDLLAETDYALFHMEPSSKVPFGMSEHYSGQGSGLTQLRTTMPEKKYLAHQKVKKQDIKKPILLSFDYQRQEYYKESGGIYDCSKVELVLYKATKAKS